LTSENNVTTYTSLKSALVLLSNSGKFKKNKHGSYDLLDLYVIYDPTPGEHSFEFIPDNKDATYSVAQFKKNGEVDWKDYHLKENKPIQIDMLVGN
jgi:hypothetical protein